jgi:hypothetical protein
VVEEPLRLLMVNLETKVARGMMTLVVIGRVGDDLDEHVGVEVQWCDGPRSHHCLQNYQARGPLGLGHHGSYPCLAKQ